MSNFPRGFLSNMRQLLGMDYEAFCAALWHEPQRALRLNPLRPGASFEGEPVPWEPNGRYVDPDFRPGANLAHFSGAYYMQEPSAMAPARALDAHPFERVLDLCAAPGGKATQLATAMRGRGALVCNEPDAKRAKALSGNLERLGVANALVVSAQPETLAERWPESFDAILVDAPCSGEGMFRRDEEARAQWTDSAPQGCAARQARILRCAARMLRPGGRLCYSTCTFNALENEGVVEGFLREHPQFQPMAFALPGVGQAQDGMLRLWPHKLRGEGHFVALFEKQGEVGEKSAPLRKDDAEALHALARLREAIGDDWLSLLEEYAFVLEGDRLWAMPADLPDARGLRKLRGGLALCELGKGFVKPDHALAMALAPSMARSMALNEAQARAFIRGQELDTPGASAGWTLMTHGGMPLGWGKVSGDKTKNHIPKGLRLLGVD